MIKRKQKNMMEKFFLGLFVISTVVIIAITITSTVYFNKFTVIIQKNIEQRLKTAAILASETIVKGEELNEYWSMKDLDDQDKAERYEEIRKDMQAFAERHELVYVYFMRYAGENREQMIIDSDPVEPFDLDYVEDMDEYTKYVFDNHVPVCMKLGDYNSEWYGIIAAYAPVYDSAGNFVAIVGVDITDVDILATRRVTGIFNWLFLVSSTFLAATAVALLILFRRKAQAYQSASISKSEFLSRMSHEIRTPLNAIIGMSEIARNSLPDSTKTLSSINQVISSSHHLLGVLNDVLDMSKIESGKLELSYEPVSLIRSLTEVSDMISQRCEEKEIKFITNIDELEDMTLIADKLRVNQVLINLLGNAIKFTGKHGEIRFLLEVVKESDNEVSIRFSVSDNGIGMTEEQVSRLFTPFEQAHSSIAVRFGGTGLGLSISQNIIKMMGGEIKVVSKINEGSEFSFEITFVKSEKPEIGTETDDVSLNLAGKRILLAEDIAINRFIICEILASTQVEIIEAENGQQALDIVSKSVEGSFDLIFMDIQMPMMDGYEATKAIRALDRDDVKKMPIIAMTANAYKEDVDAALASGMDDHLAKPIDLGKLMFALKRYIKTKTGDK